MNDALTLLQEMSASPDLFREHIDYTARQTGFRRELVEKDFYCSVFLNHFSSQFPPSVVFKGGTCLSKVYTDFYRLSEDLDFTIPLPLDARRSIRRKQIDPLKTVCGSLTKKIPGILALEPLSGANVSTQYLGTWGYRSVISGGVERVKVEFSLREPGLLPAEHHNANTLLQNAVTGVDLVNAFRIKVMAMPEIWAEKARAALTRLEPAIRDFFDLDYAIQRKKLDPLKPEFLELVKRKLAVPGNEPMDISDAKCRDLEKQVEARLRPVLRENDFRQFFLERIFSIVRQIGDDITE